MAKARAIIKRRTAVQNIRKITRTMELIATARFKRALERAVHSEAFTRKIAELVADLGETASEAATSHPLLETHPEPQRTALLVLTSNRGLAGGYNSNVLRAGYRDYLELQTEGQTVQLEVSGKRGIAFLRFRGLTPDHTFTHFEDKPQFAEVATLADRYIRQFTSGQIDRLDVAYTRFLTTARQEPVVETLLPMTTADMGTVVGHSPKSPSPDSPHPHHPASPWGRVPYEFIPDPTSILEEIVPIAFKVRLFKCFLDAAVSEQIHRRVAMKGATENAGELITSLTRLYNRARQTQITRELSEIIGGAAALQ